ncbi:MAG: LicD family protein [Oscillospiraceae bacterium]|nr:LicD family protein [Oscillospiraceae bacterium]
MRRIKPEEIQPLLLSMLKAFDAFAKRNNIQYYAAGGTLLGAIRHHGFIPWDDDIDLFVKEDMADRILEIIKQDPFIDAAKRYKMLFPAHTPNVYPIIKLVDTNTILYDHNVSKKFACGLWVDIFKMTYWPDDEKQAKMLFAEQNRLKKMLQLTVFGNLKDTKYKVISPLAEIAKGVLLACGRNCEYWGKKLYQLGSREKTNFIGNLSWSSSMKDRYCAEWYDSFIEMPFEDMTIPVPTTYDKILKQFYNDYMQLPPENKRVRHKCDAYYKFE